MKKGLTTIALVVFTGMIFISQGAAMDHSKSGDHIHMSKVKGFALNYQLIDMTENIKNLKGEHAGHDDAAMVGTHHLMVYINGSGDKKNMKVGYLVTDPDGKKHKAMAMGMGDGFGADLPMMKKGSYTIKTKVVDGETKFTDEFTYYMK